MREVAGLFLVQAREGPSFGPTQGALLLFKLDTSVYDNRPLTLEIRGPGRQLWGSISLDL